MKNLINEEIKALKDYLLIVKSKVADVYYALTGFKQISAPDKPWFVAHPQWM